MKFNRSDRFGKEKGLISGTDLQNIVSNVFQPSSRDDRGSAIPIHKVSDLISEFSPTTERHTKL